MKKADTSRSTLTEEGYLDTTKHVKIWFSKSPDDPLGKGALGYLNAVRLILHRTKNPLHQISLIANTDILSDIGKEKLASFCERYDIQIIDIATIASVDDNTKDNELLNIIKYEISNGNLASASDIARWLSYCDDKIYSDFDVYIKFSRYNSIIKSAAITVTAFTVTNKVEKSTASTVDKYQIKYPVYANNCFIAKANNAQLFNQAMREKILAFYTQDYKSFIDNRQKILESKSKLAKCKYGNSILTGGPILLSKLLKEKNINNCFIEHHHLAQGVTSPLKNDLSWMPENEVSDREKKLSKHKEWIIKNNVPLCFKDDNWAFSAEKSTSEFEKKCLSLLKEIQLLINDINYWKNLTIGHDFPDGIKEIQSSINNWVGKHGAKDTLCLIGKKCGNRLKEKKLLRLFFLNTSLRSSETTQFYSLLQNLTHITESDTSIIDDARKGLIGLKTDTKLIPDYVPLVFF